MTGTYLELLTGASDTFSLHKLAKKHCPDLVSRVYECGLVVSPASVLAIVSLIREINIQCNSLKTHLLL